MQLNFIKPEEVTSSNLIFPVSEQAVKESDFTARLNDLEEKSEGAIKKSIKTLGFCGKINKIISVISSKLDADRLILLGIGSNKEGTDEKQEDHSYDLKTELDLVQLGGSLYSYLVKEKIEDATVIIDKNIGGFAADFVAAQIAYGVKLKSYRFDKYLTKETEDKKPSLKTLSFALKASATAESKFAILDNVAEGVFFARDLISEAPNILYPESYAELCKSLKAFDVKVEILGEKEMSKLGMGALIGVGQGSKNEPKLVVMQYNGGGNADPIAFVGKGVTFDTGGISIKPSAGMDEMKYDMAGSAAVVGTIRALAGRKAKLNAVGVIGLAENMPDGNAQRPGDIVTSMSGQTIEVLNTDAEGRLVLADALWYTQSRFKPRAMIDLATLTGAMVVALGSEYAGLFSNNDELSEKLINAGSNVNEKLWRLPMNSEYNKMMDSKVADVKNISGDRGAGSITAAQFLERFVNEVPWAHLDIAGVAWGKKSTDTMPEGAAGFGIRLLDKLVAENYEH